VPPVLSKAVPAEIKLPPPVFIAAPIVIPAEWPLRSTAPPLVVIVPKAPLVKDVPLESKAPPFKATELLTATAPDAFKFKLPEPSKFTAVENVIFLSAVKVRL